MRPRGGGGGAAAAFGITLGGGTLGGGILRFGGGTELIPVDGTAACTGGGGADIIMDVITFGGGTFGATLGTVTTVTAWEPAIGIMPGGGICDIGGKMLGGGMLGGGILDGGCKLALHTGGGGTLHCCEFWIRCCGPLDPEGGGGGGKFAIGMGWLICMFGGGTFVLGGIFWIGGGGGGGGGRMMCGGGGAAICIR